MKKLIFNPKSPQHMRKDAEEFYEAKNGDLEVKANQSWNRFSTVRGNSGYFYRHSDGQYEVTLEGGSFESHKKVATFHWGRPHREYSGPNGEMAGFWRVPAHELYQTAHAVLINESSLVTDSDFVEQVDSILINPDFTGAEKEVLSKQRIGHSRFAKLVKERAGFRCMVKPAICRNLIAAHIKPWSLCEPQEKTDIGNGLCLSPDMDGLFENGEISFSQDGQVLTGNLTEQEVSAYGLTGTEQIPITSSNMPYLEWHRLNKYVLNHS